MTPVPNGGIVQERLAVRPLHATEAGVIHLEEPYGSFKAWCGADVLGIAGYRMGSVTCPECIRLEEAERGRS